MKKIIPLLVLGMLFSVTLFAQKEINQFDFLVGHWEMKTKTGKITEHWIKQKDSLIGRSYRHTENGDSLLEEEVILKKIDKVFHFCVTGFQEHNKGKTNFKLVSVENQVYIFENPEHDFPQRIAYQNMGKDTLQAWIEGKIQDTTRKIPFSYVRK
ncbi:DUF6265 family protein [Pedobacter sp. MW01-1-1]|uniref:DUF6265 family protein n=1 Tax=Pedobacter sp. MW01-1-1 TaxID=3383027 RepID=UPI003FF14BC8